MNTNLNHGFASFAKTILIVFMVCVTFFISTNPSVLALEDVSAGKSKNAPESETLLDPIPDGPGFIMVSPFDFRPYSSTTPWEFGAMPYLFNPSTTEDAVLEAGLTLPHGATITKVTLYFEDNSTTNMSLFLNRSEIDWIYRIAAIETANAQVGYRSVSAPTNTDYNVVDNRTFSYFLELVLPANSLSNLELVNVRIDYAYTSDLPIVMR
jgi:hypothetical protein